MVKFGIEFVPKEAYWKITYHAIQAERGGFSNLWITDHFNNRNVYITLTTAALYTQKITLGPGVTNPYMVNPVFTAQAVVSLNELAPGRVVLGIGAGDKTTLTSVGVEMYKPLTAVKEAVNIIRKMSTGENVVFKGEVFKIANAKFFFKQKGRIPIYIGAQGPKMLALAGKIGDGVLINACHPKDVEYAVNCIKEGASEAGKQFSELDVAAYTAFSVDKDLNKATKAAIPVVAFIVAGSPSRVLEKHGIDPKKAKEILEALKANNWSRAFNAVTHEMIEAFSVCGTPHICIERINQLLKSGISQFVVGSPIGPKVKAAIDLISEKIIPSFETRPELHSRC
jgi:5,10-methylenetetrahydromethanopterin reductase